MREAVVRELLPAGSEDTWMAMIRHPGLRAVLLGSVTFGSVVFGSVSKSVRSVQISDAFRSAPLRLR